MRENYSGEKGEMKIAMERWRGENPQKFYETWGKVIPTPARRKLLRDLRGDDERETAGRRAHAAKTRVMVSQVYSTQTGSEVKDWSGEAR